MYEKFKMKILNNLRLNLGIKNDVYSHFFCCSAVEGHSKRKVNTLEIFNVNKKNVIARFLFLNPPPICQLFRIFSKMVT